MRRQITLGQFLTDDEIHQCIELYGKLKGTGQVATTIDEKVVRPNIQRINQALGQENDPRYLAYVVEYVMMEADGRH